MFLRTVTSIFLLLFLSSIIPAEAQTGKTLTLNGSRITSLLSAKHINNNTFLHGDSTHFSYSGTNAMDTLWNEFKYDTMAFYRMVSPGMYRLINRKIKSYDSRGRIDTYRYQMDYPNIGFISADMKVYDYSPSRITKTTYGWSLTNKIYNIFSKDEYVLNSNGLVQEQLFYMWNDTSRTFNIIEKRSYWYTNDKLTSTSYYRYSQNNWTRVDSTAYTYVNGLKVKEATIGIHPLTFLPIEGTREINLYDTLGRRIRTDIEDLYFMTFQYTSYFYQLRWSDTVVYDISGFIDTTIQRRIFNYQNLVETWRMVNIRNTYGQPMLVDQQVWNYNKWEYRQLPVDRAKYTYEPYVYTIACQLPQVGPVVGDSSICANSTQIFYLDSLKYADTYAWILPSGWTGSTIRDSLMLVAGNNADSGYITFIATTKCVDSVIRRMPVKISVPVAPLVSFSWPDGLNASTGFLTYQWYNDSVAIPNATSPTLKATVDGTYYVLAVDSNGCTSVSQAINISALDIGEKITTSTFSLYPNPNNGRFSISIDESVYKMTVVNMQGIEVFSSTLNQSLNKTSELILPDLASGNYLLKVTTPTKTLTKQFRIVK